MDNPSHINSLLIQLSNEYDLFMSACEMIVFSVLMIVFSVLINVTFYS